LSCGRRDWFGLKKSISANQQIDWERELSNAKDRLESLKMIAERGTDELKEKKKSVCHLRKTIRTTIEIERDARVYAIIVFPVRERPSR